MVIFQAFSKGKISIFRFLLSHISVNKNAQGINNLSKLFFYKRRTHLTQQKIAGTFYFSTFDLTNMEKLKLKTMVQKSTFLILQKKYLSTPDGYEALLLPVCSSHEYYPLLQQFCLGMFLFRDMPILS